MQWAGANSRMLPSTAVLEWMYASTHPCSVVLSHIQSWCETAQGLRVLIFYTTGENSTIKSLTGKCFVTSPPIRSVSQTVGNCVPRAVGTQSLRVTIHLGFVSYQAANSIHQGNTWAPRWKGSPPGRSENLFGLWRSRPGFFPSLLQYILKKHTHTKTAKCKQQQKQPRGDFRLKSIIG